MKKNLINKFNWDISNIIEMYYLVKKNILFL